MGARGTFVKCIIPEGTYSVRVRRPGYLLWQRNNQVVTRDVCHVRTARISARLQPIP